MAASNAFKLEDILVASGGERRLRTLPEAAETFERMMSENDGIGDSSAPVDSVGTAVGASAMSVAMTPAARSITDAADDDVSPRSKRLSNVTIDASDADGDSDYQAGVGTEADAAAARAAASAALIAELAGGEVTPYDPPYGPPYDSP